MADTIAGILGFTAFVLLILSGLADIILSATWTKWYFTSGVRVFNLLTAIESRHTNTPSASLLNKKLHSFWMGGFIFKEMEENNYAFRRKFFAFAPNPILHGLIKFDTENNLIVVNGYLGWFSVSFSIVWLVLVPLATLIAGVTFTEEFLLLAVVYVAFYCWIDGILYIMDYYRLKKIATVSAELWSRSYVGE